MTRVSVVVPTRERPASLRRALEALARQEVDGGFEVVVVHDGGERGAEEGPPVAGLEVKVLRQPAARGTIVVLQDDDVTVDAGALEALAAACEAEPDAIALGQVEDAFDGTPTAFTRLSLEAARRRLAAEGPTPGFVACNTQLLAIDRSRLAALGGLRDPSGGWPSWDDVDLGYRAVAMGMRVVRIAGARARHWDRHLADLGSACRRWQEAARSATRLDPAIVEALPMLEDKRPIVWGRDAPKLVLRKLSRRALSAPAVVSWLESRAARLERRDPDHAGLERLYRWVVGAYLYRGYRQGLRELGGAR